jgi:hypothetical protein
LLTVPETKPQQDGAGRRTDGLEVSVRENVILVRDPNALFYAIYAKPASDSALRKDGFVSFAFGDRPQLTMLRRRPTKDVDLIARARRAAEDKARELGWIV